LLPAALSSQVIKHFSFLALAFCCADALIARRALLATAQRGDIVVAMTDPALISIVAITTSSGKPVGQR
jgi:hypothetical protein